MRNIVVLVALVVAAQHWIQSRTVATVFSEVLYEEEVEPTLQVDTRDTTSANTTKSLPNDVVRTTPPPGGLSLEQRFYQRHLEFMKQVPKSDFIMWEGRKQFRGFTNHFQEDIYKVHKSYIPPPPSPTTPFPDNVEDKRIVYFPHWLGLCQAAKIVNTYRNNPQSAAWPHVVFLHFDEDTGGLSGTVKRKTMALQNIQQKWKRMGCSKSFLYEYLNHNDTLAVVTSQHHMFDHPKAHSIPIGLRFDVQVDAAHDILHNASKNGESTHFPRRQDMLLLSHNDGRTRRYSDRYQSTLQVMKTFNVQNKIREVPEYYQDLAKSTFIMSPPGAGWDCYRSWEALAVGTIPIIEHNNRQDGMFRSYNDLPIAWVDNYQMLTPQWLEAEYTRLLAKAESYQWEKLTKHYWFDWVHDLLEQGGVQVKSPRNANSTQPE